MKKIIGGVVVLLLAGLIGFKWYETNHPEQFPEQHTTMAEAVTPTTATSATTPVEQAPSIRVNVTPPMNGTYKGVIEVGASGFNCFVVNMDKQKNWELVSKEFGESLAYEGFATTDDVKLGLKKYLGSVFNKGVAGRNAHFVMSSGALKNPKTKLISKSIKEMGYVVNEVTAAEEGKYALRALLPTEYIYNSFTVDIGSGNTKISWYEGTALKSIECSGAKYYQIGKMDNDVYNEIVTAVKQVPSANRAHCFIIGGVPHTLAEQSRNGEERYTQLKNPDMYSAGDDVKLKSGLNIYRGLQEGSGCNTFIFDWDANFTIGFLLTLN